MINAHRFVGVPVKKMRLSPIGFLLAGQNEKFIYATEIVINNIYFFLLTTWRKRVLSLWFLRLYVFPALAPISGLEAFQVKPQ